MARKAMHVSLWKESHYVSAFKFAREGKTKGEIAQLLGCPLKVFDRWMEEKEGLRKAYEDGVEERARQGTQMERHVYERLSPELRSLWKRLIECDYTNLDSDDEYLQKTKKRVELEEAICYLEDEDRQRLFLYALINSRFSRPEACRKTGISLNTVRRWTTGNEAFRRMVAEVEQIKKAFYESALVGLVAQGDTHATIFANKTYNRDQGYGEKTEITVTGTVTHKVDELNLPIEVRRQMLEQMRAREEVLKLEDRSGGE